MPVAPNTARSVETGTILGTLTLVLVATGLLLSPTMMTAVGGRAAEPVRSNGIYVAHLVAAVLLVAFTVWHLVPFAHAFGRKAARSLASQYTSFGLLLLVVVEVVTGVELWSHVYVPLPKAAAVWLHLVATFALLLPLSVHAARGAGIWWRRRVALAAAERAAGPALGVNLRRRFFLRLAAYALAAAALAGTIGTAAQRQLGAWRVNSIGRTPQLTKEDYRLRVTGLVNVPLELSFAQLTSLPTRTIEFTHHCVEGWTYTDEFTGVPLPEVLKLAGGAKPGARQLIFKSPERSTHILTRGQTYTTNFPYEDGLHDDVLLVFAAHGEDLPPIHGFPVRLMTPRKWGYKACKWLTEIEVSPDASYRGYWERNGYHNDGDYPGPIFS